MWAAGNMLCAGFGSLRKAGGAAASSAFWEVCPVIMCWSEFTVFAADVLLHSVNRQIIIS